MDGFDPGGLWWEMPELDWPAGRFLLFAYVLLKTDVKRKTDIHALTPTATSLLRTMVLEIASCGRDGEGVASLPQTETGGEAREALLIGRG